jgi:DeoR/GlpR family transcriptional regulator of sugar metabolism
MGVTGVHPEAGLSTGDAEDAAVKQALRRRAAETIVLASSEKPLAASAFLVAAVADISLLVVPQATPAQTLRLVQAGGTKVRRAQ